MHDKGGRSGYTEHSNSAGGSSSVARVGLSTSNAGPTYPSGYVPAQSPTTQNTQRAATSSTSSLPSQSVASPPPASTLVVTRVRALYAFEPTEPGELAFEKGDIIKVVDRGYKDWWRGQLKGRTGIFPVNYVVRIFIARMSPSRLIEPTRNHCQRQLRPNLQEKQSRKQPYSLRLPMLTSC